MLKRLLAYLLIFLLTLLEIALKFVFLILWPILFFAEQLEQRWQSPIYDPGEEERLIWYVLRHSIHF